MKCVKLNSEEITYLKDLLSADGVYKSMLVVEFTKRHLLDDYREIARIQAVGKSIIDKIANAFDDDNV